MKKILVLCTGNSCRSQMAHGFLNQYAPKGTVVKSAGVETHGVNPNAIDTMKREGIDISSHHSNHVDEYLDMEFDYIITVCDSAKERCPYFPSKSIRFHHDFYDPSKSNLEGTALAEDFDKARNEIKTYCREFVSAYL